MAVELKEVEVTKETIDLSVPESPPRITTAFPGNTSSDRFSSMRTAIR